MHLSKCTPIAECFALIEEFYNELQKSAQAMDFNTFIGQRICDFDGKHFLVCVKTKLNVFLNLLLKFSERFVAAHD